ncbi:DUF4402 domain-containing protein [Sphingomonas glaciei]|uniref:DUF4402 domain-containing protein n=1 Tax=Sphingomonas glaciei TaxID=2938948 RepID=A0ABY5MS14_9SPHN|nr:DUF4402 domain-containing protein [Sphingomonas glaciei]UUR07280.1 DUF4402 domain-containing protein [Sphingomonas glaciei]
MIRPAHLLAAFILALVSTPAAAQSVGTTGPKATASVNVMKPLQLTALRNLQFGTVLVGTFTGTQNVAITPTGRTCGSGTGLTCSGVFTTAQFRLTGSNNQVALISSPTPTVTITNGAGATLALTLTYPASVTIDNSGNPGKLFEVGGTLGLTSTMADGLYTGTIDIQVAYQ